MAVEAVLDLREPTLLYKKVEMVVMEKNLLSWAAILFFGLVEAVETLKVPRQDKEEAGLEERVELITPVEKMLLRELALVEAGAIPQETALLNGVAMDLPVS